ncbi:MAG: hypothetical protein IJO63_03460 [Bacilli bacterium]|nr:hypothetical protein [Bacilli bacterium]
MKFNESVIPHYELERVPFEDLKTMVKIEPEHLKEKSSWFIIKGQLCYFKEREETRMFTEMFCEEYGKLLGFDMAQYSLAYISEREVGGKKGPNKLGLISPNYQDPKYNYLLVSDLLNPRISNYPAYGPYCMHSLLDFISHEFATVDGVEETIQGTINKYIFDFHTKQIDGNPKNMCYEILADGSVNNPRYWGLHGRKVKRIRPATFFDCEKSLGIVKTPSGYILDDSSLDWEAACPYSLDDEGYVGIGVDPRMLQLYIEYPEYAKPLMERLAYDDEYRKVIEMFDHTNGRICMDPNVKKHLMAIFLGRQEEFKRLLTL